MKNQKLLLLYLAITLGCSSCATLFNKRNQVISLRSTEPISYVYKGDTLQNTPQTEIKILVKKEKAPINLHLFNSSNTRTLSIRARKSWTYGLNLFTPYWGGLVVDEISGKKFAYPRNIFVDMDNEKVGYLPYYPMPEERLDFKNQISITPASAIGIYHPGIEIGYQRLLGKRFAIQTSFRHLLAANNNYARNASGFRVEINPKYYLKNQETSRIYTSLSIEYLRKDHEAPYDFWVPENFDDNDFSNDQFTQILPVAKRFISFTPQIGVEKYISKRLVLDAFLGAGLRYRETSIIGASPNFELRIDDEGWFDIQYTSNKPGKRLSANLDFNFRIGWVF